MARIRSIKPEYWTAEQVMELSLSARLLFIGLWNFCDDAGIHPAKVKTLKAEVFPSDDLTSTDIRRMIDECIIQGLVVEYESEGEMYWQVTGWHHQKIDRPSFKHPRPCGDVPEGSAKRRSENLKKSTIRAENSTNYQRAFDEYSTNDQRAFDERSPPEGKGEEGSKPISLANASSPLSEGPEPPTLVDKSESLTLVPDFPPMACPVEKLVSLYHELMPRNPRCKVLNQTRRKSIAARWKEASSLDTFPFNGGYDTQARGLECWREFFAICGDSDFLTGRSPPTQGRPPFVADLDFLMSPSAFVKTLENKYHREVA